MSRHRNVRNLNLDDYYDDDYYDDDYYDEEDFEEDFSYSRSKKKTPTKSQQKPQSSQQQPKPKHQTQPDSKKTQLSDKPKQNKTSSGITVVAPQNKSSDNKILSGITDATSRSTHTPQADGLTEKINQITAMGFSVSQARKALQETPHQDVGGAIDGLLSGAFADNATCSTDEKDKTNVTQRITAIPKDPPKPQLKTPTKRAEEEKMMKQSIEKIKDQRSQLSMVVLGHVDAGKSTLMGQLLLKLGVVNERQIFKYQKQAADIGKASFALAWVMDENDSERERGVTMEVGTKFIETKNHNITILDAPGHRDFIPSMITGAAFADVGLLVVAATPGEFEDGFSVGAGQTREHIILSRGLGVSQLIVAVNKLDSSQPAWSQDRFEEIKTALLPFLQSNGYPRKKIRFVPVSGLTGINISNDKNRGNATKKTSTETKTFLQKWYQGPTLVEAIDMFSPAQRNIEKPLRLVVNDVYGEGKGVTIRGRVVQGHLSAGSTVSVLPVNDEAVVSRVENLFSGVNGKVVAAGDNVEVLLGGIDVARISPGCILCLPSDQVPIRQNAQAQIVLMDNVRVPLIRGAQMIFHMHSLEVPVVITHILSASTKMSKEKKIRPRVVTGGSIATVQLKTEQPICMEEFHVCRAMGRFVLRRKGETIAVGIIESLISPKKNHNEIT